MINKTLSGSFKDNLIEAYRYIINVAKLRSNLTTNQIVVIGS
jgi:hypothetical protein